MIQAEQNQLLVFFLPIALFLPLFHSLIPAKREATSYISFLLTQSHKWIRWTKEMLKHIRTRNKSTKVKLKIKHLFYLLKGE